MTDTSNNKTSYLVNSQVPFFVRNDHPNFIRFLEAYYEFLEQQGAQLDILRNMKNYYDVDESIDTFLEKFYSSLLKFIPKETKADKVLLLKNIKQFYLSKGTEKSVRFLMRLLFNEEFMEFYYPKNDILRASDGKWFFEKSVKVTDIKVNGISNNSVLALNNFTRLQIKGNTSNATAIVERADSFYENGVLVKELKISNVLKEFTPGEQIFTVFVENGVEKTLSANLFTGAINTVQITNPGIGYSVGDRIIVESNTGSGAEILVSSVTQGNITFVLVDKGGSGFQLNNPLFFSGGGGSGAQGFVSQIKSDGSIHPNSYSIAISTISQESNSVISNTSQVSVYETFAYQNLTIQYTNTSNLLINTGSGGLVTTISLNRWKSNSNVFFETYDSLNVNGTIVLVTSSNTITNTLNVSPGLAGNLNSVPFVVIKRANNNTPLANAFNYFTYANTGPALFATLTAAGTGYSGAPQTTIVANTRVSSLGILGSMEILDGGVNYQIGDSITFTNSIGGYGTGAAANVKNVSANGSITEVQFVPTVNDIIGGSGYSQSALPFATVNSANGTNAKIIVTSVLGAGEKLRALSGTFGSIRDVIIVSRGSGYEEAPTLNLRSIGDGTAQAVATIISGTYTYPGRYLNDDGHLSGFNFLENRDYYQQYSYVLRTKRSLNEYRKPLKELIHPSGVKFFGEYVLIDNGDTMNLRITRVESVHSNSTLQGIYSATTNANGKLIVINTIDSSRNVSSYSNVYLEFSTNSTNLFSGSYVTQNVGTNRFEVYIANTALSGTVSANNGLGNTNILVGSGTQFTKLRAGDVIKINGLTKTYYVGAVANDINMTLTDNLPKGISGNSYSRIFYAANSNGMVYFTSI